MSLSSFGRRFERLLFFAAPLSFVSLLTLFVVFASETQKERVTARCYEQAARLFEQKLAIADALWDGYVQRKKGSIAEIDYVSGLRKLLTESTTETECHRALSDYVALKSNKDPSTLIESLRSDSRNLLLTPIKYSGVELPEKATIGLMGTTISIDLKLFANLLQVVLAPLLLLWLGSLYNTRYRETLLISKAKQITEIFPHLVNIYPAVRYPEPRRRSHVQPYFQHTFSCIYAGIRISLMLMFISPSVIAYVTGVFLQNNDQYRWILIPLALLVGIFVSGVVLIEILPWHFTKYFPGLPLFNKNSNE